MYERKGWYMVSIGKNFILRMGDVILWRDPEKKVLYFVFFVEGKNKGATN